jgi:5'-nucleotidase/UDP-sugar diphosphatase
VLGGHDHEPVLKRDTGAAVVKAGGDAEWLAVAELRVERPSPGRPARVRAIGLRLIPNVDVAPSPRIAPLVAAVEAELQAVLGQPLGRLAVPLDTRTGVVRTREAAMGDLMATN